ncbi:unnamed protein product [Protopolystoma xenopodis]|uniref:Uncharacterized protein n=1 Tax=Protopolystoma xenopodis TaxID=117903 RepID=A0A3S5FF80_9PLAT|nr:unnamed protein product [Protopolystoma xenopodis]
MGLSYFLKPNVLRLKILLITGQEIIVGLSPHTNEAGAQAVARAFPEYPTTIVPVHSPYTSLKSAVSMAGINVMAVCQDKPAQDILKIHSLYYVQEICRAASYTYKVLTLPEPNAVQMLYVNNYLLHLPADMIPNSTGP